MASSQRAPLKPAGHLQFTLSTHIPPLRHEFVQVAKRNKVP